VVRNNYDSSRRFRRRTARILVDSMGIDGVHCDYGTTLGAGGLFIETDSPCPVDTQLKLRFRLSQEGELHEIEGRVIWCRTLDEGGRPHAPGMGVQFTDSVGSGRLARDLEDLEL
jgi:uncharacterized protein (TIGR02266 family)